MPPAPKPPPLAQRLLWFAALWLGGVGTVAIVSYRLEAVAGAEVRFSAATAPFLLLNIEGISAKYKIGSSFLAIAPSLRFDGGDNCQTAMETAGSPSGESFAWSSFGT